MNWLIYISGWVWGWALVNGFVGVRSQRYQDAELIVKLIAWTMTWIWICWRFIA